MKKFSKHTMFAMVAVLATSLFSCTKDDGDAPKEQATQFADASFSFKTEAPSASLTGREDVQRGTLYTWIKSIHLEGGSMELTHPKTFDFDLVDNGTSGVGTAFNLTNLAIGRNDFNVTTTTSTVGNFHTEWSNTPATYLMEHIRDRNPFALYTAHITTDIRFGVNNSIEPVTLRTQHGRHIGIFNLGDKLGALGVYAIVTPIVDGVTKPEMGIPVGLQGLCYWSDENCTAGKTIQYDIRLYRNDRQPLMDNGLQIGFISKVITIQASTSTNRIYTITHDALEENTSTQTFVAEEWVNDNGSEVIFPLASN